MVLASKGYGALIVVNGAIPYAFGDVVKSGTWNYRTPGRTTMYLTVSGSRQTSSEGGAGARKK